MTVENSVASDEVLLRQVYESARKASHLLEVAKESIESVLDDSPEIILVLSQKLEILRANRVFAKIVDSGHSWEELVGVPLSDVFSSTNFSDFQFAADKLKGTQDSQQSSHASVLFESSLIASNGDKRNFAFTISYFGSNPHKNTRTKGLASKHLKLLSHSELKAEDPFLIFGQDITELRQTQKDVSDLLDCIPVGLLTIGQSGLIEAPISRFMAQLLGSNVEAGLHLSQVEFFRSENIFEKITDLLDVGPLDFYQKVSRCNSEILFKSGAEEQWIDIKIHPIFIEERVHRLVLVVQNKTELVLAQKRVEVAVKAARTDPLTGLSNRQGLETILTNSMNRMQDEKKPVTLVMIDIDSFKLFNDFYGHLEGDMCLKKVAGALKTVCRNESDLLFRFGGEEFLLFLPDTDFSSANLIAEKLLQAVSLLNIPHAKSTTHEFVSVSAGVFTHFPSSDNVTIKALIQKADDCLYKAKNEGRNRFASQTDR